MCTVTREKRWKIEDHFTEFLRTIYPYGFNERAEKHDSKFPIGLFFTSVTKSRQRSTYLRNDNVDIIFLEFQHYINNYPGELLS